MSQEASFNSQALFASDHAKRAYIVVVVLRSDVLRVWSHTLLSVGFYYEKHRHIFGAIDALDDARKPGDTIPVASHLDKQGVRKAVGGPQYLARLRTDIPLVTNIVSYIDIVKDYSLRRQVVAASREMMRTIAESPDDATSIADGAASPFTSLAVSACRSSVQQLPEPP